MDAEAPPHAQFDLTTDFPIYDCDMVVHCAAYTNVTRAETDRLECFNVNVYGTLNLLEKYKNKPFVFISSEYAHKPVNFYALTKSLAEQLVETHPSHLIIRTLFKPRPWAHPKAFADQYTQGDYVDVIAPLIAEEIKNWDKRSKTIYVGTGRKTIFDLARQTRDVEPISVDEIKDVKLPKDYL
jgi:dTDP-4-dehydrorhamnose reductase